MFTTYTKSVRCQSDRDAKNKTFLLVTKYSATPFNKLLASLVFAIFRFGLITLTTVAHNV